jgi:hypothetical protein
MLPDLLLRNWILNRRALLSVFGIFVLFEAYFVMRMDSPRVWLVATGVYATFLTLSPLGREDKFRTASWACTLPVTRLGLVRAHYLGAWLMVAVSMTAGLGLAVLLPGSRVSLADISSPAALFMTLSAITLILSLMLPFTIRFGIKGVLVFLVALQILGAGALLFAIATGGRQSGGGNPIRWTIGRVTEGVTSLQALVTPLVFYIGLSVVLVAVGWLGYRLAAALFERREL